MGTGSGLDGHAQESPPRAGASSLVERELAGFLRRTDGWEIVNGQVEVPSGGQLKVSTPRGWLVGFGASSVSCSGLFHAVGVAVGDYDAAVVQQPVEQADGGGVFG